MIFSAIFHLPIINRRSQQPHLCQSLASHWQPAPASQPSVVSTNYISEPWFLVAAEGCGFDPDTAGSHFWRKLSVPATLPPVEQSETRSEYFNF